MTNDVDISERLARLESEMASLKKRAGASGPRVSNELIETSKQFVKTPTIKSAQTFLSELDKASVVGSRIQLGIWTVTITVVTILSDDHGD